MKLGYFFQCTAGGAGSKELRVNCHEWDYFVSDQRDLWYKYSVNDECVAITMLNDGMLIPVVRMIRTARPKDNIATWIYVPSKMIISGDKLESIINRVKEINRGSTKAITEATFVNDPILNADFAERKYPKTSCRPEPGSPNAYRTKTPFYSIKEILDNPFQDYYCNYKFIFLFNDLPASIEGLVDISDKKIKDTVTALPPSDFAIRSYFGLDSVKIMKDKRPFTSPVTVEKGSVIKLEAYRTGYVTLNFVGQAVNDEEELQLSVNDEWRKKIDSYKFVVKDSETGSAVKGAKVELRDCGYDRMTDSIPVSRLNNVSVYVSASGYKDFEGTIDFSQPLCPIELTAKQEERTCTLTAEDGRKIKVTFSGKRVKHSCPLEGYTIDGDRLLRIYSSGGSGTATAGKNGNVRHKKSKYNTFLSGFLSALVLILLGLGAKAIFFSGDKEDKKPSVTVQNNTVSAADNTQQSDSIASLERAIAYLGKNKVWHRDSMEEYPVLKGLYEELNTYDFSKILNRENTLSGSNAFMELVNVVKFNKDKNITGKYNKSSDFEITVAGYKDKLYKTPVAGTQPANPNAGGVNNPSSKSQGVRDNAAGSKNTKSKKSDASDKNVKDESADAGKAKQQPLTTEPEKNDNKEV